VPRTPAEGTRPERARRRRGFRDTPSGNKRMKGFIVGLAPAGVKQPKGVNGARRARRLQSAP